MKRILALLCVIACLCGLCVPALAANDTVTIHAYVPDDWTDVRVWAWNDSRQNPTSASWPGDLVMTKGADGWYTVEMPQGYPNMLINGNEGNVQTKDITGVDTSKDVWIRVGETADGKYYDFSVGNAQDSIAPPADVPSTPSTPAEPSKLNSLALVGDGIPGVKSWVVEDPAGDMTKVEENVYTKVIAVTADTNMQFKIAGNDVWDDAYNFGAPEDGTPVTLGSVMEMTAGGGSKNYALSAGKACNLKFTVNLGGDVPTLLVEETTEAADTVVPSVPSGDMITVYAKVPDEWSNVCVWAWDDTIGDADPSGWPGTLVMTKGDNGWYSVQVPNWVTGVLLHANDASVQTIDMVIEAGKDIWINARTNVTQPTVHYEEVEVEDPKPTEPPTVPSRPIERPTEPAGTDDKAPADNTVLFCIIGSVVVIGIAVAVYFILSKKKK